MITTNSVATAQLCHCLRRISNYDKEQAACINNTDIYVMPFEKPESLIRGLEL